ncbi:MAG TPA: chemotaxis protein CheA [Smithella sp.]|jgi:two-component system chemotaxis sensor kinase CheA|nr:chemotaxis protein CheA [Smithella sp.]NMC97256.1 chemotaxis protein CheA [Deltaproteobacteria bacterium]HOO35180.1 chemotaxis protein CheA [Smithella sp.]HPC09074.1 chemotaxis protein CheA [Smithella sp.]HPK21631.1 chemotaxis protein CheA [Smithella sp.]
MNLNRLAISLIELNPENPADLEEFKKNLLSCYNNTQGRIQNILKEACFEADAMVDQVPELQRNIIARLGVLLEQAMGSDETDISATTEQTSQVEPAREPDSIDVQHVMLSADLDADLLNEFIIENMEWATMAESAILDWEQNPGNQELLNTIFRGFHTIKGTSAFVNLDCVKDLAHQVESVLAKVRDGEHVFTRSYANLALKSLDVIKSILEQMKSSGPGQQIELPRGYQGLLESLRNFVPDEQVQEMAIPAEESMVEPEAAAPAYTKTNRGKIAKKEGEASSEQSASSNKIREQMTESTVRVKVDRLDKLLDTVGELVIAQTMVGQDNLIVSGKYHELNKKISQAGKIVRELHDLSMFLRMVPLKGTFQKMVRLTRDLSLKHGKMVSCITEGDDIEIDRNMVDMVADPLIHLIRNAVDHGIEFPEERRRAGKSENGRIYLTAGHAEGSIMLTVWDDGRGMNRQTIVNKAIQKGLIDSAERMTDQEVWQMIFLPGFSTAEKVTEVSGRGVGMDVVKQAVEALRGRIEVQTTEGQGCTFIMRMPLTMAITDGMIVKVGSQRYILPTANIHKAVRPQESDIHTVNQRAEMLSFRDEMVPVIRLYRFFDIPDSLTDLTSGLLVVIGEGKQRCALFVDELLGQTQVVTKLLGKGMNNVPGIAGGAIMGDGTVGLILDASGIVSIARQQTNTTT